MKNCNLLELTYSTYLEKNVIFYKNFYSFGVNFPSPAGDTAMTFKKQANQESCKRDSYLANLSGWVNAS